ncbi:GNAT family N-acetyltransferase [Terricaulis sp.]|uniref:GNAT family N-acetyltransferase n=1 Tax=Terricaulis sp. TaxID=2768686 RepID=UPI0037832329
MSIVYRDATPEDAAAIAEFAGRTFCDTFAHLYPPEDLDAFLAAKYGADIQRAEMAEPLTRYFIAIEGDRIAGYVMMGALDIRVDEPGALELHRLYVDKDMKGKGVAQALTDEVIAWARAHNAPALYLSVWENNHRAQAFYKRYGFAHVGEHKFMVGRVADRDFIWRLTL